MEPVLFVKLTEQGNKNNAYVNLTKVTKMYPRNIPGYESCTVICSCDNSALYVEETPDEIMRKALEVIDYDGDCI